MKKLSLLVCMAISCASAAYSRDVYLFQGHSEGPAVFDQAADGPEIVVWDTDAFFFNGGATDARIEFLDDLTGTGFTIPPQRSASLSVAAPTRTFQFLHARVPDSVIVENALFIGEVQSGTRPTGPIYRYGKVRLPVFTSLTAANEPQVHLGTFLGEANTITSHENVWIYNGGDGVAAARVEIRRQCDDAIFDERNVSIAPKTALSVSGLGTGFRGCVIPVELEPRPWSGGSLYTVVVVDQPSVSFVSTVANGQIPKAMVSVN